MTLRLNGDSSGFTEIKAADAAGDNSIKLPASNGSANQLLQNGGTAGELQYTNAGGGLYYDSSGRLLAGTSSSRAMYGSVHNQVQIEGSSHAGSSLALTRTGGGAPQVNLASSANTSFGVVGDGNDLGIIAFMGADGSVMRNAAGIHAEVEGSAGSSVMPAKLVFATNGGSASPTPRVEIGSNGALKLLAGCPGIDFSAIQSAAANGTMVSEVLDSYEEGTWTPNIGGNATYTFQQGTYVKVGRIVMINFYLTINAIGTGATRIVYGLPFNGAATTGGGPLAFYANLNQNFNYISAYIYNASTIAFYGNSVADNNMTSGVSVFRNNATVQGSIVYYAA